MLRLAVRCRTDVMQHPSVAAVGLGPVETGVGGVEESFGIGAGDGGGYRPDNSPR
jgi:hypothetical protein